MYYKRKQQDGTYIIYERNNRDPVLTGVRGCNVERTINQLYWEDFIDNERSKQNANSRTQK